MTPPSGTLAFRGLDFDFLVVDLADHVAILSTAGGGFVPAPCVEHELEYGRAIREVLALRASTRAVQSPVVATGCENIWADAAERGLFGYDSDAAGADYKRVARPQSPVVAAALPEAVRSIAQRIRIDGRLDRLETIGASAFRVRAK